MVALKLRALRPKRIPVHRQGRSKVLRPRGPPSCSSSRRLGAAGSYGLRRSAQLLSTHRRRHMASFVSKSPPYRGADKVLFPLVPTRLGESPRFVTSLTHEVGADGQRERASPRQQVGPSTAARGGSQLTPNLPSALAQTSLMPPDCLPAWLIAAFGNAITVLEGALVRRHLAHILCRKSAIRIEAPGSRKARQLHHRGKEGDV